ncbi:sulfatase-like hydrolase/transferase [Enterobacter cloacae]|nr:sulfatase-like hydrolase/transferase [Enterobacter cloacae]
MSDHGESLGESGLYLHGTPYKLAPDQQTHIPMQVWMSPGFIAGKHINMSCLENNAAKNHIPTTTCSHRFWGCGT